MDNNEIKQRVMMKASAAKGASRALAIMTTQHKNNMLAAMADALAQNAKEILFHNEIDVEAAKESGLSSALIDRLTLNEKRIDDMIKGIKDVILLEDPVGTTVEKCTPSIEIDVKKIRVPLGVISMIYESRPNVTVDAATLCLKAGNAVVLKGGSEAINSNRILAKIISEAGIKAGMPAGSVQFIDTTDRTAVLEMIKLNNFIDLLIPRGSEALVNFINHNSSIPVLSHGKGLCHTYVDEDADMDIALKIAFNAKCQRPGVCNAMETLLVHKDIAKKFLPLICQNYFDAGVKINGCTVTKSIVPSVNEASQESWSKEYHDLELSIKVVGSVEEAIGHINKYGSMHSDAIVTNNKETADKFLAETDSSAVFHNASTRLHDGSIFGLGCEIGISTMKLHARGTMGIKELTTTKYIVRGNGTVRN
ncbi:MAG: glutamate-5-semialdehyde dehydrogenase [Endomicrobium sp.]|jgi:glutamate-5-semialdehyde dehydrogenase|nr:glutamate-5-semialdehyde dehydrogenase [Endomicrobium sp.]